MTDQNAHITKAARDALERLQPLQARREAVQAAIAAHIANAAQDGARQPTDPQPEADR